jgi:hypothetical protein
MLYAEMKPDKEYRGAIHHLETIRLRRMSTLEGAIKVSDIHNSMLENVTEIQMFVCAEP